MDDIKIKLSIEFSITESDLEDGLAEYDELSVASTDRRPQFRPG